MLCKPSMKLILVLTLLMGPTSALANNQCTSLFGSTGIGSSEAKELFEFLESREKIGEFSYTFGEVRVVFTGLQYWIDFSKIYYNKNELQNFQKSLLATGFRSDHPIFSTDVDISNPRFRANKMNSEQAQELFEFLIREHGGYLDDKIDYHGLFVYVVRGTTNTYYADFRFLNNRGELGTIQSLLRAYGFKNSDHPIFR